MASSKVTTSGFTAYAVGASKDRNPSLGAGATPQGQGRRVLLYLVRHAQAEHNVAEAAARSAVKRRGGSAEEQELARQEVLLDPKNRDASLSATGTAQVGTAAAEFKALLRETQYPSPNTVLVSPLGRTLETAALLFPGHRTVCLERLREKRTGRPCDERKSVAALQPLYPHVDFSAVQAVDAESDAGYTFTEGVTPVEGNEEVRARSAFLLPYVNALSGEAVAVVAHKGFLREFFKAVAPHIDAESEDLSATFGNAEVRVVEVHFDGPGDAPPTLTAHSLATVRTQPHVDVAPTPRSSRQDQARGSFDADARRPPVPPAPSSSAPAAGARMGIGSSSCDGDDAAAVDEAWDAVVASFSTAGEGNDGGGSGGGDASNQPEFVAAYFSPLVDGDAALGALRRRAAACGAVVAGGTYQQGALLRGGGAARVALVGFRGFADGVGVGACAIEAPESDGTPPTYNAARAAGECAARAALGGCGGDDDDGARPDLIQSFLGPGHEEAALDGVREVFGEEAALFGGSVADDSVVAGAGAAGAAFQLVVDGRSNVAELFPAARPAVLLVALRLRDGARAFAGLSHLYAPTSSSGRVTKCNGRLLSRIDDRPAATVVGEWMGGGALEPGLCLRETALHPLAVPTRQGAAAAPYVRCIHMKSVTAHGDVECFAELDAGAEVTMLAAKPATLVGAVAGVARAAVEGAPFRVRGALVDICAGTATALNESHLRGVAAAVEASLPPDVPFLTYFSFGEQGMVGGRARHGNLMLGVTLFGGV